MPGGNYPELSVSEADINICPCCVRCGEWLSCSVCTSSWRSNLLLLCQVVTILGWLHLKLTVPFAFVVLGGDIPAMSVYLNFWSKSLYVCISSWRSRIPLFCQVVTFLRCLYSVYKADYHIWTCVDYPALSVSEADGHICPCCVRWWLSCAVFIWSKSPHPSGRNWKSWSPMRDQGKKTEGNDDILNPLDAHI